MTEEAKAARAAYRRQWAKNNPQKIKQHNERYWQRKAQQAKQQGTANPEGAKRNGSR